MRWRTAPAAMPTTSATWRTTWPGSSAAAIRGAASTGRPRRANACARKAAPARASAGLRRAPSDAHERGRRAQVVGVPEDPQRHLRAELGMALREVGEMAPLQVLAHDAGQRVRLDRVVDDRVGRRDEPRARLAARAATGRRPRRRSRARRSRRALEQRARVEDVRRLRVRVDRVDLERAHVRRTRARRCSSGSGRVAPCTTAPGAARAAASMRSSQSGSGRQSSSVNAIRSARASRQPTLRCRAGLPVPRLDRDVAKHAGSAQRVCLDHAPAVAAS